MKIQVKYISRSGNTKKLADAIAQVAGVEATSIKDNKEAAEADVLFLGASVYWGGIDGKMKSYINDIDANKVKEVVVFSTSSLAERAFPDIKKRLEKKGVKVSEENFYCRGEFAALYKGRPNEDDINEAKKFTEDVLRKRA